jgi:hypothetical protein
MGSMMRMVVMEEEVTAKVVEDSGALGTPRRICRSVVLSLPRRRCM